MGKKKAAGAKGHQVIARNRVARHNYTILDTFEAGIQLLGSEVKSLREGKVSLREAHVRIDEHGEAWVHGMHIAEHAFSHEGGHTPMRPRKLLLHRRELDFLRAEQGAASLTIVPLQLYFSHGLVKMQIGLAQGKKLYDKRQSQKSADADREIRREIGRRLKTGH